MKPSFRTTLLLFCASLASCAVSGAAARVTPSPALEAPALEAAAPVPEAGAPATAPNAAAPEPVPQSDRGPRESDWELTLGGSGASDSDFDNGSLTWAGSVGYFIGPRAELGARQSLNYSDFGDSLWNGSTRLFWDYHFLDEAIRPVLGANFGWVYGDTVDETLAAAPEAGVKWYLTESAFLFFLLEYQFFFDDTEDADEAFDDGSFVHTLGLGVRL